MPLTLEALIARLSLYPPDTPARLGFGEAHSYRGFYEQLAFCPHAGTTAGAMLKEAQKALHNQYPGYRGGMYQMGPDTPCHVAAYDDAYGTPIDDELILLMLGPVPTKEGNPMVAKFQRVKGGWWVQLATVTMRHTINDGDRTATYAGHLLTREEMLELRRQIDQALGEEG